MPHHVIIVAGGIGSRMKADRPKQFIDIDGIPIIVHTIRKFLSYDATSRIVICVHRNYRQYLEQLITKFQLQGSDIRITTGGETRFDSVKNGLALVPDDDSVVAIHDAARPLVSVETIQACFSMAELKGNAIPVVPVNESMRKISNNVNHSVNRNEYRIIQTPQCFKVQKIKEAFAKADHTAFTDDASVLEATGEGINLVEGNPENIKITSPFDLVIAKALLKT